MPKVMIEAKNLGKNYDGFWALRNASFMINQGEIVGLVGPNGAGKSTAMKILTCFISPTEGDAKVNGVDIFGDSIKVRQSIGYLPETTPLYPEMTVFEYLEYVAEMRGIEKEKRRDRIKKVITELSLKDMVTKEIRALSKGYRQRVGLAQALIHEPPILILDEPMSGLDPNQAEEIREHIREIGKKRTVILSTHNLNEIERTCDRVIVINQGEIVADATPLELRTKIGHSIFHLVIKKNDRTKAENKNVFKALEGIKEVRVEEFKEEIHLTIIPERELDMREDIFKLAVKEGMVLLELHQEKQEFNEVFKALTQNEKKEEGK